MGFWKRWFSGADAPKSMDAAEALKRLADDTSTDQRGTGTNAFMFANAGNGGVTTNYVPVFSKPFDGEKTRGELGAPLNLIPDYRGLRARSYQMFTTQDTPEIVSRPFFNWTVGSGLKMQAEPDEQILQLEGVNVNLSEFRSNVEAYWELFANSPRSDFSGMVNLHKQSYSSLETTYKGGDCLIVCRLDDAFNLTVQLIDGQHIVQPTLNSKFFIDAKERGTIIQQGVERNAKGEHVAYYVLTQDIKNINNMVPQYERISARGEKTGLLMAWIKTRKKQRIDHVRGIPTLTPVFEKMQKLDNFTEATVSGAQERAKNAWYFTHGKNSDGENPLAGSLRQTAGREASSNLTSYNEGALIANNIKATEGKTVYNLPIDSDLKTINSTAETNYGPFMDAMFPQIAAASSIPGEVALQKFGSNYSASRAAIQGFGYIIDIERVDHASSFENPIYNIWLYVHILKSKVDAPGYLEAMARKDYTVIEAYSKARFRGTNQPNIDELKTAKAIRTMLGDKTKGEEPLISREQASELLNAGEWSENIKKYSEEKVILNDLLPGIDEVKPAAGTPTAAPSGDEEDDEDEE